MNNIFKKISNEIIYLLSFFFPKNKKLLVFGAWFGHKFADNPKYLFISMNKKYSGKFKCVWITKNKEVCEYVRSLGYSCYMTNSVIGVLSQLRTKMYFTCTGSCDVNKFLLGRATHIELWHGVPLKKIGFDDEFVTSNISNIKLKLIKFKRSLFNVNDKVVCTSDTFFPIYQSAFLMSPENVLILGQPRNDVFYDDSLDDLSFPEFIKSNKVILYMPTHRNEGQTAIRIDELLDLEDLNEFCVRNKVFFLIKKHFFHANEKCITGYSNIFDITNVNYDSQLLLKYADVLITDYSSCYIDYLLLDRPIVFFNFDMDHYLVNDRAMYFEYEKVTPGVKVVNYKEMKNNIEAYIENGQDNWVASRNEVKNLFYKNKAQKITSEYFFALL